MQEQNFEKQVKQKMEELSVAPSAPVWMKVEEQIRQKRSRRRIFFWLFPVGFLLAGLLTWSVIRFSDKTVATQPSPFKENNTIQKTPVQNKNNDQFTKTNKETSTVELPANENLTIKESNPSLVSTVSGEKVTVRQSLRTTKNSQTRIEKGKSNNAILNNTRPEKAIVPSEKTEVAVQKDPVKTEVNVAENPVVSNTISDSTSSTLAITTEAEKQIVPTEETKTEIAKPAIKNKWTMSPYLSIGVSSIQYFTGSMEKANTFSSTPGSPGIGSGVPPMQTASDPTNGASINLGVKFLKPLNKRLKLTTGLGYYYASTHIKVGQTVRMDSVFRNNFTSPVMVDQFYTSGQAKKYTNSYHFIEIPIGINWKVNKNIPLDLETGISVAQLIASNTLTFDGNGNYYENRKLLYKTHFTLNGGLSYRLFSIKGKSFYAGPYFKYHFTQLEKSNSGQYLFSAGLGMKLNF